MAAAECAENTKAAPPPELVKAWNCQRFNCLPKAGGLDDQPAGLIHRMSLALNYYNAVSLWNKREFGKDAEFKRNYPNEFDLVKHVREMRKAKKNAVKPKLN